MNSHIHTLFLKTYQASLRGETYELSVENSDQLRQLFRLASQQSVLPMIYEAVYQSEAALKYPAVFHSYRTKALNDVAYEVVQTAQFLDLHRFLVERGLRPAIVKGITLRSLYPRSCLRLSVDEDLVIPPEEIMQYHRALTEYGLVQMEPNEDPEADPEISYVHPNGSLYIEVHKHLIPPNSEAYGSIDRYFTNLERTSFSYRGQELLTIPPTDHAFFLICHSFKHFLHSGFGLRQVSDLILFSDAHAEEIDWQRLWKQCCEIHAEDFVRAIYQIGRKYLIPSPVCEAYQTEWKVEAVDECPILDDILASGIHGVSELSRTHSSTITLNAVISQNSGKKPSSSIWKSVFLPLSTMRRKYSYLKSMPFLLPVAWAQRIFHYLIETFFSKKGGSQIKDSIQLGKDRVELFKYYHIIK